MALREGFIEKVDSEPEAERPSATVETLVPKPDWPITMKLRRPIIGNKNEQVTELIFREPSASDILRCGNPVLLNGPELIIDERKMMAMMAQLSGVLQPLLDRMNVKDWSTCAYRLLPFFVPDWAAF